MQCTSCSSTETKVLDKRETEDKKATRRRRECLGCQKRFTTYERIEHPSLVVVKRDGTRQLFSREKLLAGLQRACEKTTVTNLQLEAFVADVERELYGRGEPEVASVDIGELIMTGLSKLNEVAYVRFASVYRSFRDISGFERELSKIRQTRTKIKPPVKSPPAKKMLP